MTIFTTNPAIADARPDSPLTASVAATRPGHPSAPTTMPFVPTNRWLGGVGCEDAQIFGTYAIKRINPGRLGGST